MEKNKLIAFGILITGVILVCLGAYLFIKSQFDLSDDIPIPLALSFIGFLMIGGTTLFLMFFNVKDTNSTVHRAQNLNRKYDTNMTRFGAAKEAKASAARSDLLAQTTLETGLLGKTIEAEAMAEEAQRLKDAGGLMHETKIQQHLAEHRSKQAQSENIRQTVNNATKEGLTLSSSQTLKVEKEMVNIRVSEHERKTNIDLENRWKEIVQDLDAADLLEISETLLIKKLTQHLIEMRRERYQISQGEDPPEVMQAILDRYDKNIEGLENKIDGRQNGLVPAEDRKEIGGSSEAETES